MLRRILLYLVLVAAFAGFFMLRGPKRDPEDTVAPASAEQVAFSEALAERARRASHLAPDSRFLDAVGEVERAVTGAPAPRATADWNGAGWTIRAGHREVGRVSEFPRFAEMRELLIARAGALGARESITAAPPVTRTGAAIESQLAALHVLRAADLADHAWASGLRDRAIAALGARALVWLAAESFDAAGAGEAIPARALAWNAVVCAVDSTALRRETTLLAELLGYSAEACGLAAKLPAADPVALYVLRKDDVLDAMASRGGQGRAARWLALRRCVERGDLEAWAVAADRGFASDTLFTLPLLSSALALGRFETGVAAGAALLGAVTADLRLNEVAPAPTAAIEDRDVGQAMEMFETLLESMPEGADGAFLDRRVLAGWYRAAFYSSLFHIGQHLRERLSDTRGTLDFAHDMGDGSRGPEAAAEFQRWFAHLADLKADDSLRASLKADLSGMPHFGHGPRLETWEGICERTEYSDPFIRLCARWLQRKLDTRPATLMEWANITGDKLFDVAAAEPMWAAAVQALHPHDLMRRGWWAAYRGDRAALDRLLTIGSAGPHEKSRLIHALRYMMPGDSLRLDQLSERLVAEQPDDWSVLRVYVEALAKRHRNDRVRALAGAWLARPDRSQRAFDDIDARNRYARACLEDGRIEEGYETIAPVVRSWQGTAMSLGAELLDRRGRGAEAETLAVMHWRRYPDSDAAQALVIDLWWRHGKFDLAARALASAPRRMTADGWRYTLGPRFARFERERPRDARRAVDAMIGMGLDDWKTLGRLVVALSDAGRHAPAAEFTGRVRSEGKGDPSGIVMEYESVKAARGADAASEWLKSHLPDRDPRTIALIDLMAVSARAGEILWALPMPAAKPETVENLWLARVVVAMRDSVGTPEQLAELRTWFAKPDPCTYRHFGRMLLGLVPVDSILVLPLGNRAESEACYYIGLRRQAEGDAVEAARWYARCLDLNVLSNAEHHWAMNQMVEWLNRAKSLERIAAEDLRATRSPALTARRGSQARPAGWTARPARLASVRGFAAPVAASSRRVGG